MNKNIELEYKVLLNKEQFDILIALYPDLIFRKQVNTYYDTKDMSIRSMKGAMRIREVNNSFIFTLKMHKDNDLLEYECEVEKNAVESLQTNEINILLKQYGLKGPFQQLTSLTTYRGMHITEYAEICFDKNYYGDTMDYEIEYEYKKEHDGLKEFQAILDHVHITYEKNCASKIKRALDSIQ